MNSYKMLIAATVSLVFVMFSSCAENAGNAVDPRYLNQTYAEARGEFPEASLQSGSNENYSFRSLQSIRKTDGSLELIVGGWGIQEMGILLWRRYENETLRLKIGHFCGTVSSITNTPVKFDHLLTRAAEDTLSRIVFIAAGDSLVLEKK